MFSENFSERLFNALSLTDAVFFDACPQGFEKLCGRLDTRIGHDERSLELLEQGLINLDSHKQRTDALPSLGQTASQPG